MGTLPVHFYLGIPNTLLLSLHSNRAHNAFAHEACYHGLSQPTSFVVLSLSLLDQSMPPHLMSDPQRREVEHFLDAPQKLGAVLA